ncbi:MAG: hypothetical protein ACNA78_05760 [Balneolaceae bacterium]
MKKYLILLLTLILSICTLSTLQAQDEADEPLALQMQSLLKSEPFNLGFLMQSTIDFSFQDDNFNNGRRFGVGTARLKFDGVLDKQFAYNMQLEFINQLSVIDLALGYQYSEQFHTYMGAQKPDLSLELQPNPGQTDFINRARLVGIMLNPREIGVTAIGTIEAFDYNIGIYNGFGLRTIENDNKFMYAAKAGYLFDLDNESELYLGGNFAINTSENEQVGNTGFVSAGDRLIFGGYAQYRSDRWFGTAEYLGTNFDLPVAGNETIHGIYTTIGKQVTENDQLVLRWDHISFNNSEQGSELFVLGWNRDLSSLFSVQVNLLADFDGNDERVGLSGNFQFQF